LWRGIKKKNKDKSKSKDLNENQVKASLPIDAHQLNSKKLNTVTHTMG
jgi:hypothetical protein